MTTAKDVTKEAPRSPRTRMGDYVIMARMIDKGRAILNGTAEEYRFGKQFQFIGVSLLVSQTVR